MDPSNPYEAPLHPINGGRGRPAMTVGRGLATVIASAIGFAALGTGVGYTLGVIAPEYYRTVFTSGHEPGFDPVQVGIGLGLTQGMLGGGLVGLVVVLAVAMAGRPRSSGDQGTSRRDRA